MGHRGGAEPLGQWEEEAPLYRSGQGSRWKSGGPRRDRGAIPSGTFLPVSLSSRWPPAFPFCLPPSLYSRGLPLTSLSLPVSLGGSVSLPTCGSVLGSPGICLCDPAPGSSWCYFLLPLPRGAAGRRLRALGAMGDLRVLGSLSRTPSHFLTLQSGVGPGEEPREGTGRGW